MLIVLNPFHLCSNLVHLFSIHSWELLQGGIPLESWKTMWKLISTSSLYGMWVKSEEFGHIQASFFVISLASFTTNFMIPATHLWEAFSKGEHITCIQMYHTARTPSPSSSFLTACYPIYPFPAHLFVPFPACEKPSDTFWVAAISGFFFQSWFWTPKALSKSQNSSISQSFGYGSIPINTIFRGMNIHLPAILMFTRGTTFWHTAISLCGEFHGASWCETCWLPTIGSCKQSLFNTFRTYDDLIWFNMI